MSNIYVESPSQEEKKYPTQPDTDGFFYEDKDEEARGISTKIYDNNNPVKRVFLSDGRPAIVRRLKGRDIISAPNLIGNVKEAGQSAIMGAIAAMATKVDNVQLVYEDLLDYWASDYNKISQASLLINFI